VEFEVHRSHTNSDGLLFSRDLLISDAVSRREEAFRFMGISSELQQSAVFRMCV
jgi:hypothetical protein